MNTRYTLPRDENQNAVQAQDFRIVHALDFITDTYGDNASVDDKKKDLLKYGRNAAVGTSAATIMTLPGTELNETYVERNLITHVASASANDTQIITIEGHTAGSDISVSSITQTSGTATVTTATAHGFEKDEWIFVNGANQSEYNGIVKVLSVLDTTSFTYTVDSGASSPATGTITVNSYDKTFVVQNVTLAGQTKTALATPLARATRAFVAEQNKAFGLTGPVYVAQDVTFSSGVPQTDTAIHLIIPSGKNQTRKAATSLSSTDYWIVTSFRGSILEKAAAFADVELQVRRPGGVFREVEDIATSDAGAGIFNFNPYLVIPKNSDIRLVATADGAGTDVSGSIQGYLAIVQT